MKPRFRWSLQITTSERSGVHLLVLTGRLGSTTAESLREALDRPGFGANSRVLVDLSGVDYLSSAGLQVLERAAERARATGGRVVVCGLQEPVQVSFEVSGAGARLDIAETVTEATERLGTAP
jgi:anti-anti-sigma factor